MPIEHTYLTYAFSELSEEAQQAAIESTRNDPNYMIDEWWDCTYDLAKEAGALIGLEIDDIWFSGFCSQGDGASMKASYSYVKGWKAKLVATYGGDLLKGLTVIGECFQRAQAPHLYQLTATTNQAGRYHSQSTQVEHSEDPYRDIGDAEDAISECITDFTSWIYKQLEQEYEHINSDETIKENIESNDWQFTLDGHCA